MKEYDFICSLGGNCSVAHNLLYRKLRKFSLPFDWTYFLDSKAIYNLADSFAIKFSNQLKKENLKELPKNAMHPDKIQYEDMATNIIWPNHFEYKKDANKNFIDVKSKINRRFQRLLACINDANKILFIFATTFELDLQPLLYLYEKLKFLYPDKEIDIRVLSFNCEQDETIMGADDHITLCCYKRDKNLYDFIITNIEWSFLDEIKLSKNFKKISNKYAKHKIIEIKKIKRGLEISLIPFSSTLFMIKTYLFGISFNFSVGRFRD